MRKVSFAVAAIVSALILASTAHASAASGAASTGAFGAPFAEPGPNCPEDSSTYSPSLTAPPPTSTPCKPAAVNLMQLWTGNVLYWDGLEGMEYVQTNTVLQYGGVAVCDQARLLDLGGPSWSSPVPVDAGCTTATTQPQYIVPGLPVDGPSSDGDALFCSSQVFLANGDVLTTGGTKYYEEPNVPGTTYGVSELEGSTSSRVYHVLSNHWTYTGSMNWGRWYPSLVTLPSGNLFVASGVTKLLKPIYPDRPADSGTNVKETETYSVATGKWTYNGASADHSLPLYPRLHLLPDGRVYYDAGGQTFNPDGQAYDEATWNFPSIYDPKSSAWTNLSLPALGFRGSAFSVMLPLTAPYSTASFLSGGGVYGVTPGTYLANNTSQIDTVDTAHGDAFTSSLTGNLNNSRWYSTAIVLPDGKVMAFSGATADEVVAPGTGMPVRQAEEYDPATGTWTAMASATDGRTYHNPAILLPTGQVLVGGHSPINTLYANQETLPGGFSNNYRDDSFEIYNPPYLSYGKQPRIEELSSRTLGYAGRLTIETPDARAVANGGKVMLVRNPADTHLVDGDQRMVQLTIVGHSDDSVTVTTPPNGAVAPPGPYMLFIDAKRPQGLEPSHAAQVFVEQPGVHSPLGEAPDSASSGAAATTVAPAAAGAPASAATAAAEQGTTVAPALDPAPVAAAAPVPVPSIALLGAVAAVLVTVTATGLRRRRLRLRLPRH